MQISDINPPFDVSNEPFARQRIHMKNQALFSSKDKSKKLKCRLLQFLFGTFRAKRILIIILFGMQHCCILIYNSFAFREYES